MSDNGGPAFPVEYTSESISGHDGMTLRDWFAGQAMIALTIAHAKEGVGVADIDPNYIAPCSFNVADAMLAAREANDG